MGNKSSFKLTQRQVDNAFSKQVLGWKTDLLTKSLNSTLTRLTLQRCRIVKNDSKIASHTDVLRLVTRSPQGQA